MTTAETKTEPMSLGARFAQVLTKRHRDMSPRATATIDRLIRRDPEKLSDAEVNQLIEAFEILDLRSLRVTWSDLKPAKLIEAVRAKVLGTDRSRERILEIAATREDLEADILELEERRLAAVAECEAAERRVAEADAKLAQRRNDRKARADLIRAYNTDRRNFEHLPFQEVE